MKCALVTIVHGRHDHLRRQRAWIAALDPRPDVHVVVGMGDPGAREVVAATPAGPTEFVDLAAQGAWPLAAARNAGVGAAASLGADAVVLLDVDCLPETTMVADHTRHLRELARLPGPSVIAGRVRYLPPGLTDHDHVPERLAAVGRDHPVRVVPRDGRLRAGDPRLLWSLNLGLTLESWERIGGFDERYIGYGGEDTDFGQRLAAVGGTMWWSGVAGAFHQHHAVSDPPVEHAADIARNATLFRSLWGFDPMAGWLREMERSGHLVRTAEGWEVGQPVREEA
jgi:GT2 family glycosyltransferase